MQGSARVRVFGFRGVYPEGQGDLVSRLIVGIVRVTIWVAEVIDLLTKSPPDPPSMV